MPKFKIEYRDPNNDFEWTEEICEFEDWTGKATNEKGEEIGETISISAYEWADDYAYGISDKGEYKITELK